jgi:hypothetical protein
MTRLLLLAPALLAATLATGCGCSIGGQSDTVFARGQDQLILCDNGGFVATVASATLEGRQSTISGQTRAATGATGARAFTLSSDGVTATSTGLGDGAWQPVALDSWAKTHANQACLGLEQRPWWAMPTTLPVPTAFAGGATQLLLCPDGTVHGTFGDGTYSQDLGDLAGSAPSFTATLLADGTLAQVTGMAALSPVAPTALDAAYRCAP